MNVNEEPLVKKVRDGICPFTGERYDCARCDVKPKEMHKPNDDGMHSIHMCVCITGFVTGLQGKAMLRAIARSFTNEDGSHPTPQSVLEYFNALYRLGVKLIPICKCKRFCFKHGCMGGDEE